MCAMLADRPLWAAFLQLDIAQQEYIHESGLRQYEVVGAALDRAGAWLATVEERAEDDGGVDVSLKLWAYSEAAQRSVRPSHQAAAVSAAILVISIVRHALGLSNPVSNPVSPTET